VSGEFNFTSNLTRNDLAKDCQGFNDTSIGVDRVLKPRTINPELSSAGLIVVMLKSGFGFSINEPTGVCTPVGG